MWTVQVLKHIFASGTEEIGLVEMRVEGVTSAEPKETSQ